MVLPSYDTCTLPIYAKLAYCPDGSVTLTAIDVFSGSYFYGNCPKFLDDFWDAWRNDTINQFLTRLENEAAPLISKQYAANLINADLGHIVYDCDNGPDVVVVRYTRGSCVSYCVGRSREDQRLVVSRSDCGFVCCTTTRTFCYNSDTDSIDMTEETTTNGTANCAVNPTECLDTNGLVEWFYSTQCFTVTVCE